MTEDEWHKENMLEQQDLRERAERRGCKTFVTCRRVRIRCKKCNTILDTEILKIEEKQKDCACGEIFLDWHGCRVGAKSFRTIDTLGDKKLEAEYIRTAIYYEGVDALAIKLEAKLITEEEYTRLRRKFVDGWNKKGE